MATKILIVDDHEIVREGIRTLIARARPKWEIIGEANRGVQAIEMCETLKPDVMVLDITMPGMSGLEVASKMAASRMPCRVLMFTMHESEMLSGEVRQSGAHGFVLKSQAARDLIRAIDCLLAGGTFFGSEPAQEKNASDAPPLDSTNLQSVRFCREPIVAANGANGLPVKKRSPTLRTPRFYGFDRFRSSNPLADKFIGLEDYRNTVLDVLQVKAEGALKNGKADRSRVAK
jgi:DNA-binding NarL/FixJ family response regulator